MRMPIGRQRAYSRSLDDLYSVCTVQFKTRSTSWTTDTSNLWTWQLRDLRDQALDLKFLALLLTI